MTFADVEAFIATLPGSTKGTAWNRPTWAINGRGFAWQRPLTKADLGRLGDATPPAGDLLAIHTGSLDDKDALLAIAPRGFFTIEHFNNYPAILVELRLARVPDVKAAILAGYRALAAKPPAKPRRKPAKPRARKRPAK